MATTPTPVPAPTGPDQVVPAPTGPNPDSTVQIDPSLVAARPDSAVAPPVPHPVLSRIQTVLAGVPDKVRDAYAGSLDKLLDILVSSTDPQYVNVPPDMKQKMQADLRGQSAQLLGALGIPVRLKGEPEPKMYQGALPLPGEGEEPIPVSPMESEFSKLGAKKVSEPTKPSNPVVMNDIDMSEALGSTGKQITPPADAAPPTEPFSGIHYSQEPVEGALRGGDRGKAVAGSEGVRLQHDNKVPGVYVYREGARPEPQIGSRPYKSTVTGNMAIADIGGDQRDVYATARSTAFDKYKAAGDNDTIADQKASNDAEAALRGQGYHGYENKADKTGRVFLFGDQPVEKPVSPETPVSANTETPAEGENDLAANEIRSTFKEPYSIRIQDADGTEHVESVDAFSSKQAIATAQKKFPSADVWGIVPNAEGFYGPSEKRAPSTEYTVPTGKLGTMPEKGYGGKSVVHTIRHELGHAMVGQDAGLTTKGMISSSHPSAGSYTRAALQWDGTGLREPRTFFNKPGRILDDKVPAVVKSLMGGIAADEAFNDVPRALNHNLDIKLRGSDGNQAYGILREAGYDHDTAMNYMHKMIDASKEYLQKPEVSGIIKENEGTRETGLSTQYHYSPERLKNMHAEAQRRIANAAAPEGTNAGPVGTGNAGNGAPDVAAAESGATQEDRSAGAEPITAAEKKKPDEADPAQTIADLHAANGGSTYNLAKGNLAGTDSYSVSTNPERSQVLDHPPTPKDIRAFMTKNQDLLKNPDKSMGTWHDTSNNTHALDVVSTIPDREQAIALGRANNQKAIYGLKSGEEINTGGTGETPTVSTRVPTKMSKGAVVENHADQSLTSDMEAAKAAPGYVQKMANRIQNVPGVKYPEGGDAQAQADTYIRHVADNVKFVQGKLTPAEIARDEQWYPVGAHERVLDVAKQHGFTPTQVAGVTAVESPMTDWDVNTALAERTANIWKNQQDTEFTPEMQKAANKITSLPANKRFKKAFKPIIGKTLGELTNTTDQALWLRLYDEAHNPREYQTWNPDGTSGGLAKNMDGSPKRVGWSFQRHIEKAIDILKDGSPENISKQLGYGHKVRNFYNNMIAPDDPRYLTIDTHAVNVGQLRPMSGKAPSVSDNFGGIKNGAYGLNGTYPLNDAGYRLAAKELDIAVPSRLQSPVWTKIREVFNDNFKTQENLDAVDAIWKEHTDGKITADQARQRVWDYATRWNADAAGKNGTPSDPGKLFEGSLPGESSSGTPGRGTGSGTTGGASETVVNPNEGDTSFNFGANAPVKTPKKPAKGSALNFLDAINRLKKPAK